MKTLAIIENNVVINKILTASLADDVVTSLKKSFTVVDITNLPSVDMGHTYNGTAFLAPPRMTEEEYQEMKASQILALEQRLAKLKGDQP